MKNSRMMNERITKYAAESTEKLYIDLELSDKGLNDREIEESRKLYGENILSESERDSVAKRIIRAFINPFTVILFVLAVISFVTDFILAADYSKNFVTPIIIGVMLIIAGITRFIEEMKAKHVIDHMSEFINTKVSVLRKGKWINIPAQELVTGDRVKLIPGESVPADIRLTSTNELFISQSVITGESTITEKNNNTVSSAKNLSEYSNIAFMGSGIISGSGEGIVLAVGKDTVYGGFSKTRSSRKNGFDKGANSIAWVLIRFMVILIPIVFIACGVTKGDWFSAFLFALSVAIGLTPEMLPMVINACLAKGSTAMSKKETIVKNINAMQTLGSMDVLCVDKTGTLTQDTVILEYYMDILGNENQKVLDYAYLASFYHAGNKNHLDSAVLKCRKIPGHEQHFEQLADCYQKLDEVMFDYDRKFSSVLVRSNDKNIIIIKGSVFDVFKRCRYIEYNNKISKIESDSAESVHAVIDDMLESGMKVIAVAYREFDGNNFGKEEENSFTLLGYLTFFDAPKKSAASAIGKLKALNVDIKVLTGDQSKVAVSICSRLGIDTECVMTGEELENLSENDISVKIERTSVFAEISPKQKALILQTLQANGHTVGFLGDGMNDLPAMAEADVGISVDTAAEAVKESADVLLLKKDLNVLEKGILEGRKAFVNMSKYINITASSNFGNIVAIVIASVFLPFFPMTSVQLLLLNLLYDILCLVLPWDNIDKDAYTYPPEWSGKNLGRFMKFFGPISSLFDIITFAFLFFVMCPFVCGGDFTTLSPENQLRFISLFQTGWFLESMWTQVLIIQLLRTKELRLTKNKPALPFMSVTLIGILLFTVLPFTPAGGFIGLTPLPASYFVFLIAAVVVYLSAVTLAKSIYVKKYRKLF